MYLLRLITFLFFVFWASAKLLKSKYTVEPVPVNLGEPYSLSFSNNNFISLLSLKICFVKEFKLFPSMNCSLDIGSSGK